MKELAQESLHLKGRVFFHGRLTNPEVLQFLKQASFLVVNSNIETFSVISAEALLMGKPVIATHCGGPELFIDETNGLVIPRKDDEALETAIKQMLKTYSNYDSVKLSRGIKEKFGAPVIGRSFVNLYEEVLKVKFPQT